jgi:mannose-6-phosphate isomerase-like protein (cupin superfamily)
MNEHHSKHIPQGEWHQLVNPYEIPCRIVEIQYGLACDEEDIERKA